MSKNNAKRKTSKHIQPVDGSVVHIKSRGISTDTASRYGVVSHEQLLYFPIHSTANGRLINYKTRPVDMSRSFGWHAHDVDLSAGYFFGTHVRGGKHLVIASGETDTLSFAEALPSSQYTVWGLTKGEQSIVKALESVGSKLDDFNVIYLALDNDDAGISATESAVDRLPLSKTRVIHYPTGVKDANELLVSKGKKALKDVVGVAATLADNTVDTGDNLLELLLKEDDGYADVRSTGYDYLDTLVGGWLPGHVVAVAADTGLGKSTITMEWAVIYALTHNERVMVASLEMSNRDIAYKLTGILLGIHTMNPKVLKKAPGYSEAARWVAEHFVLLKHKGYLEVSELTDMVRSSRLYGASMFLLDHLTAAATGPDGLSWSGLDARAQALQAVTAQTSIITVNVTHISRSERDPGDGSKAPSLARIRGGNGLAQNSSAVLGLYAPEGKEAPDRNVFVMKKHRAEIGQMGEYVVTRQDEITMSERRQYARDTFKGADTTGSTDGEEQPREESSTGSTGTDSAVRESTLEVREDTHVHSRQRSGLQGPDDNNEPEGQERKQARNTRRKRRTNRDKGPVQHERQEQDEDSSTDAAPISYSVDGFRTEPIEGGDT